MMIYTCAVPDKKKIINYIQVKCSSMNSKTKFLDYVKSIRKMHELRKFDSTRTHMIKMANKTLN